MFDFKRTTTCNSPKKAKSRIIFKKIISLQIFKQILNYKIFLAKKTKSNLKKSISCYFFYIYII